MKNTTKQEAKKLSRVNRWFDSNGNSWVKINDELCYYPEASNYLDINCKIVEVKRKKDL